LAPKLQAKRIIAVFVEQQIAMPGSPAGKSPFRNDQPAPCGKPLIYILESHFTAYKAKTPDYITSTICYCLG
jgi:hypothetical protein